MAKSKKAASKKAATPKTEATPKKVALKIIEEKTGNHFIDDMSMIMLTSFCEKQGIKVPANSSKERIAEMIKKAELKEVPIEIKNFAAEY